MKKYEKRKIRLSDEQWLKDYYMMSNIYHAYVRPWMVEGTYYYEKSDERKFKDMYLALVNYLLVAYNAGSVEKLPFISISNPFPNKDDVQQFREDMCEDLEIISDDIDWSDIFENAENGPHHYSLRKLLAGEIQHVEYIPTEEVSDTSEQNELTDDEDRSDIPDSDDEDDEYFKNLSDTFPDLTEPPSDELPEAEPSSTDSESLEPESSKGAPEFNLEIELDRPVKCPTGIVKEEAIAAGVKWIPCDVIPPLYEALKEPTWKEDLYLAPYEVPCIDLDRIFFERKLDDYHFIMYESYPPVPTVQNEITCTTNEEILTNRDRMKLYPNRYIKTRPRELYNAVVGMEYHELLGSIVPVEGFTTEQIIDNIIRYPHFHCMRRIAGDGSYGNEFTPFWGQIEIDGELHKLNDVWKDLPESKVIPKTKEFMKEYQIRRYLLERDAGINHKYPLQGDLGEFITLFMTPEMYIQLGYTDVEEMAKKCVHSRVKFHRTRNPMLRRFGVENQ